MAYPFRPMTRKDLMRTLELREMLIPSKESNSPSQKTIPPKEQSDLETAHQVSDLKPF